MAIVKIHYQYSKSRLISNIQGDDAPVEFNYYGQGREYIALKQSCLHVKAKIARVDGAQFIIGEKQHLYIDHCIPYMRSQLDVYMDNK